MTPMLLSEIHTVTPEQPSMANTGNYSTGILCSLAVVQRLKAGSCVSSLNWVSFFHIGSETTVYTECEGVADGTLATVTCILGMIAGCRSCISAQM